MGETLQPYHGILPLPTPLQRPVCQLIKGTERKERISNAVVKSKLRISHIC